MALPNFNCESRFRAWRNPSLTIDLILAVDEPCSAYMCENFSVWRV